MRQRLSAFAYRKHNACDAIDESSRVLVLDRRVKNVGRMQIAEKGARISEI
jgi:hypothetical protein